MSRSLADIVRAAGVVGAGGAGFPTHVKVAAKADVVIANGAECEPLLHCDKAVMEHAAADVLRGLRLVAEATGARRKVLALKRRYHHVVEAVERALGGSTDVELVLLDNFYPAGDEHVLVNLVTAKVIPEGGIPLAVGALVDNVITLRNVARAVDHAAPVTSRTLTVHGAVARPITLEVPIGAPMSAAVALAGGAQCEDPVYVDGGPMMGAVRTDPETPVSRVTSGIIVLPRSHPVPARKLMSMERELRLSKTVCCQCRFCTDLCPRYLLGHDIHPHLVMRSMNADGLADRHSSHVTAAFLCCLCGVCETYACPLGLSPRRVFEATRRELGRAGVRNPHQRQGLAARDVAAERRVPVTRLVARLGIANYYAEHPTWIHDRLEVGAVRVPLAAHFGAPALPVVAPGARVREGDLVAEIPEGKLGARAHASVTGVVRAVSASHVEIERS